MPKCLRSTLVGLVLALALSVEAAPGTTPQVKLPQANKSEIDWDRTISNLEKIATISGIVVGGLWAYFKFFRGRVFVPRLDTNLVASLSQKPEGGLIVARIKLKNVGLSLVEIHQQGTALRIAACRDTQITKPSAPQWEKLKAFSVFEHHKWIEAGETIQEEIMIVLPASDYVAYRLEARLIGSLYSSPEAKHYAWRDVCIVHNFVSHAESLTREAPC